ncbi:SOS response-associated peptidase family protein [Cupriavidus pauculus]|uniref:SOS response-associated peptidase family protein n=1 Tax=Cupriavidus pauculus TaxID=82633 RepID=UPI001FD24F56|nr:SOS response-associated peptidase family protein [Cupriavidus pauculus]
MCVNYAPVQRQILRDIFGVEPPPGEWRSEAWPDYPAPIIRRANDSDAWESVLASFSMVPKKAIPSGTRYFPTANARVETIGQLRSFAPHWRACQFALIPATAFFEPNWETGKAVRWKIGLPHDEPFAIAGLWRAWPDGAISSENHPLMKRFHKPGDEKRSVVLLPRAEWEDWLTCRDPERARTFLQLYPAESLIAEPAPMPPRTRKSTENTADT